MSAIISSLANLTLGQQQKEAVSRASVRRRRRSRNSRLQRSAKRILCKIPTITRLSLNSWLSVCKKLDIEDDMYSLIQTYIENSQVHGYGMKMTSMIEIVRKNDYDSILQNSFSMWLFHGTTRDAIPSILQNGFKLPDSLGQMLGSGIYFADRASKSANYCDSTRKNSVGYIFLCNVMLGECYNAKNADQLLKRPPPGFDSVRCTGANIPDPQEIIHVNGSVFPFGNTVKNKRFEEYTVNFNEYAIYNPNQINSVYLVKFLFTQNPYPY